MEKKYDPNKFRDEQVDNDEEITDALNRIIERAKVENEALKEMLKKIAQKKTGRSK